MKTRTRRRSGLKRKRSRRAADDKRYNDMMQMMQMVIASKNSQPIQPVEPPEKMMLTEVMGILKDNMKPQAPQDVMQHPMFLKLFDHVLDESKGKPSDALMGLAQEIASVKDKLEHIGGGPMGLPSNPEQLHAYVDYMKTMADIDRTKNEFAEKSETRKLISTIAETGLKTVGEAIAATFIVNPGTPQAQEVPVRVNPIDDGSVIQFDCPGCGAKISAPADARAVMCPNCKSIMDRAGQQMNQEQLEALQKTVEAEQGVTAQEVSSEQQPPTPALQPPAVVDPPSKKESPTPGELGPVSRQTHQTPHKKEEVQADLPRQPEQPEQPPAEENNIIPSAQPSEQGGQSN